MAHKLPSDEIISESRAWEFYDYVSDRLSFNDQPLRIVDSSEVSSGHKETAELVNSLYFKLGSLLEELAYQSASNSGEDRRYELALGEIGLISEFAVQLAEKNDGMNVLTDTASEELYRRRGDAVRFWVGDFEYLGEKIDFHIMIRPKSHEVPDATRPGVYTESRQARLGVELLSRKYHVGFRLDPGRSVCIDLDAPILRELTYEGVNQSGAHHFYTETKVSTAEFKDALNLYSAVLDSRIEKKDAAI